MARSGLLVHTSSAAVDCGLGFRSKYLPAPLQHNLFLQWGCGVIKEADLAPGSERQYREFTLPDPEPLKFPLGSIVNINMFNMEFHPGRCSCCADILQL
jgi:hypothetical protein